eukprot:111731-Hanusia_phi.AAC.1
MEQKEREREEGTGKGKGKGVAAGPGGFAELPCLRAPLEKYLEDKATWSECERCGGEGKKGDGRVEGRREKGGTRD